jgi:hypothetical protein
MATGQARIYGDAELREDLRLAQLSTFGVSPKGDCQDGAAPA